MKKQVVVIHGGKTFMGYKQYITSLRTREVSADTFTSSKGWKDHLQKELGKNFQVFTPKMPNPNNAVYKEWKIWFERMSAFLTNDVILIGHSLGGIFLVKYLSENIFPKKIKALVLIAAPCDDCNKEDLAEFVLPRSLKKADSQAKKIYLVYSKDDPVVPLKELDKYGQAFSKAESHIFKHKQHFNQEHFPEIVKLIKKI